MADPTDMASERNVSDRNRWKIPQLSAFALAAAIVAMSASAASAAPAAAPHPTRSGGCSGSGSWTLTVRANAAGGLTVKFSETGGDAGDVWHIYINHDALLLFSGSRTANGNGAVTVTRKVANLPGLDTFTVSANDNTAGESCTATASY